MNLVVIMTDTLRADHIGCYGNDWIKTPYLDKLAKQSVVFDRAYAASFPTVPNRTDLFTGRFTFPFRDWQPLEKEDVVLSEIFCHAGYTSMLITDTQNMVRLEYNFARGFDGFWWIRGQENDPYINDPHVSIKFPCASDKLREPETIVKQYLKNTAYRKYERDYFAPQVFSKAIDWLETNYTLEKFFLWIDSFDPHEPWDPPYPYNMMYTDPNYSGEQVIYPKYGDASYMTKEELQHVRGLYAGEVTMVDKWVGLFLDKLKELNLDKNTLIVFTSDHGHYLGERGVMGKPEGSLYEEMTHISLMIRYPGAQFAGKRISAFVQPPDVLPTVLDIMGIPIPEKMKPEAVKRDGGVILQYGALDKPQAIHGQSLKPVIESTTEKVRDRVFTARNIGPVTVSDGEWVLICCPQKLEKVYYDRIKILGEIGNRRSELYFLSQDPWQKNNLIRQEKERAYVLHKDLLEFLQKIDAPKSFCQKFGDSPYVEKIR